MCVTEIGHAVLEIFHFKTDFPRISPEIKFSTNVNMKNGEQ